MSGAGIEASGRDQSSQGPRIHSALSGVLSATLDAATKLPALRKPAVLRGWVLSARAAQVALAAWLLVLLLLLPPLYGTVLGWIFPPVASGGITVFGKQLGGTLGADPRVEAWRGRLLFASWVLAGGTVGLLLWVSLPRAVARASAVAREKEEVADSMLSTQPSRSVLLYQTALSFAVEPEHEAQLRGKLSAIDRRLAGGGAAPEAAEAAAVPGATLVKDVTAVGPDGRYRLVGELGRGGMGVVYAAKDAVLDRDIALKELPARLAGEAAFAERFRREARVLAKLSHPNIVQVFDLVDGGGRLWMAMELMEGGELDGLLQRVGKLPLEDALAIARPLADALAFAHGRGIVHRDFKPANVLFTGTRVPKVTDFGLAKLLEEAAAETAARTQDGAILGSPRYMSPEQASGRPADVRADVYSFGVTLYRMLTGRLPFDGDTASLLAQHITQPPPAPRSIAPELPAALEALLLRALEKDPSKRPGSMSEMAAALAAIPVG